MQASNILKHLIYNKICYQWQHYWSTNYNEI